ncbi:DUF1289 domain-containing protein [Colwelliaceae bacterium 6471]
MNDNDNVIATVASPCVRNCCLDNNDICLGCYRHIDEITGWNGFTNEGKTKVLYSCQQRKLKRKQ